MIIIPDNRDAVIYCIWNNVNDNCYIGSTKDFRHRILTHVRLLKNNKHHSKHLQHAYNKYGEDNFELLVLKKSSLDSLLADEQWCLDILKPIYNSCKTAGNTLGLKWTDSRKEKQLKYLSNKSTSHIDNLKTALKSNPNFMKMVKDRCKIMSINNQKPIIVTNILTNTIEEFSSIKEASEVLGISKNNINSRLSGKVKSNYKNQYKFNYK
jgi:group I intron endonuclease